MARNDIDRGPDGKAGSFFSRLEITVRPQNEFNVVNICGKGAIRDKEIFSWNHFEDIAEADQKAFEEMIDKWVLEFAEQFAARTKRGSWTNPRAMATRCFCPPDNCRGL